MSYYFRKKIKFQERFSKKTNRGAVSNSEANTVVNRVGSRHELSQDEFVARVENRLRGVAEGWSPRKQHLEDGEERRHRLGFAVRMKIQAGPDRIVTISSTKIDEHNILRTNIGLKLDIFVSDTLETEIFSQGSEIKMSIAKIRKKYVNKKLVLIWQ